MKDPVLARYRLQPVLGGSFRSRAEAIAREQTLEVPPGAATPEIEERYLGCVRSVGEEARTRTAHVEIAFPRQLFDGSLTSLLNVVWGNVSLMDGVLLSDLELPDWVLDGFSGPRFGIAGIRSLVGGVAHRPLVSSALKPLGLTTEQLVVLARTLTRAGVDVIKDDHGLANQTMSPFAERVQRVAEAVRDESARAGTRTVYFPNVTAGAEEVARRADLAREVGCPGVVLCPGLTGMDAMRRLALDSSLAIMAHPSHANASPSARQGVAPDLLIGTLWRLAGADAVIYVNARGRFAWPVEACQAVNRRARMPLGNLRPAFPVPAGGIQAREVEHWFRLYGSDTLLLIGGSVLEADDGEATARSVVQAAIAVGDV